MTQFSHEMVKKTSNMTTYEEEKRVEGWNGGVNPYGQPDRKLYFFMPSLSYFAEFALFGSKKFHLDARCILILVAS